MISHTIADFRYPVKPPLFRVPIFNILLEVSYCIEFIISVIGIIYPKHSERPFRITCNDTYSWWTHIVLIRYLSVMAILQKFGSHVRELRSARGITQENLAGLAGLSRQYIGDVERGTRNISLENIAKIAAALEITLPELLDFQ
jgi:DNA-binding XRE family transcriptional regulator